MKRVILASLCLLAGSEVFAGTDSPEEGVRQFYGVALSGHCERAAFLRPGFTKSRCEKLHKADIGALSPLANDGSNAVVMATIALVSAGASQQFNGYIHLQKRQGEWILLDFAEASGTNQADYISRHVKIVDTPDQPIAPLVAEMANVIGDDPAETLAMLTKRFPSYAGRPFVLVDVSRQNLMVYQDGQKLADFPVSTAVKGAGNQAGSDQTPLGAHRVSEKFGDTASLGSIFIARQDSGKIADILTEAKDLPTDHVTTRILWLDGLELGKNQGGDVDSHRRFIYIHGTPEEGLIGKPASHGCIRMKNNDVISLYELIGLDALVYIGM